MTGWLADWLTDKPFGWLHKLAGTYLNWWFYALMHSPMDFELKKNTKKKQTGAYGCDVHIGSKLYIKKTLAWLVLLFSFYFFFVFLFFYTNYGVKRRKPFCLAGKKTYQEGANAWAFVFFLFLCIVIVFAFINDMSTYGWNI